MLLVRWCCGLASGVSGSGGVGPRLQLTGVEEYLVPPACVASVRDNMLDFKSVADCSCVACTNVVQRQGGSKRNAPPTVKFREPMASMHCTQFLTLEECSTKRYCIRATANQCIKSHLMNPKVSFTVTTTPNWRPSSGTRGFSGGRGLCPQRPGCCERLSARPALPPRPIGTGPRPPRPRPLTPRPVPSPRTV